MAMMARDPGVQIRNDGSAAPADHGAHAVLADAVDLAVLAGADRAVDGALDLLGGDRAEAGFADPGAVLPGLAGDRAGPGPLAAGGGLVAGAQRALGVDGADQGLALERAAGGADV